MFDLAALPGNTHVATVSANAPRLDLYVHIHKALRQFMSDTVQRLGAMDVADAVERSTALDAVDALLRQLRTHLQHENDFIHTAIEARRPGGARHTADDHVEHVDAIANLEDEARALRDARPDQRAELALRLYRHLAAFVGENFVHMQVEETENNAALWALYSDDELAQIHGRLMATIAPPEMALTVRWMAAALSVPELAGLFAEVRHQAPPAAFEALLDVAGGRLDDRRWAQLCRALGRAPAPGLVTG